MTDEPWNGLDPEVRAQAAAAAEELGVSLDDYLTELLLEQALDVVLQDVAAETAPPKTSIFVPPAGRSRENFAVKHRLDGLDRRVSMAIGSLDSAINAVDSSVLGLAARMDETETVFGQAAETLSTALTALSENHAAVRDQLGEAEGGLSVLNRTSAAAADALAARCADLDQRLAVTDDIARDADRAAAELSLSHDLLKHALADDFADFTHNTSARLAGELGDLRAAAEAAAAQADAAVAHLVGELRALRENIEARIDESVATTQSKVQSVFTDSAQLHAALNTRVVEAERTTAQHAETFRARLIDVEDGAQTALEETANSLRVAHAALAGDVTRAAQDTATATEALRAEIIAELAEQRDWQGAAQARLKLIDGAVANTMSDVAAARDTIDRRVSEAAAQSREALTQARDAWSNRFDSVVARVNDAESDAAHAHHIAMAETARVEACTLAALEKAAQDRAALENVLRIALADETDARTVTESSLKREIDGVRQHLETETAALRGQSAGLNVRLDLIDTYLAPNGQLATTIQRVPILEAGLTHLEGQLRTERPFDREVAQRLFEIEAAIESTQSSDELIELRTQVNAIAQRLDENNADETVLARLEDARARLGVQEGRGAETADRVHGLARLFGRLSAQSADAATQSEDRLHKLELAFADLRLDHFAGGTSAAPGDLVAAIQARVVELEERQAAALDALRAEITLFLGDNDRRLVTLENDSVAEEFQLLRQRVEERLIEAERKSVRSLEQVMETVALIGRKIAADDANMRAAKSA